MQVLVTLRILFHSELQYEQIYSTFRSVMFVLSLGASKTANGAEKQTTGLQLSISSTMISFLQEPGRYASSLARRQRPALLKCHQKWPKEMSKSCMHMQLKI